MIEYLTLILICELMGEFAVSTANIPFPGPVMGMVLLFIFLVIKGTVPRELTHVSGTLLNNLSLMFVPAGVGIMAHFDLLGTDAWPLLIALVISTLLTVMVTALVMNVLSQSASTDLTDRS